MSEPVPKSLEQKQPAQAEGSPSAPGAGPLFVCVFLAAVTFLVYLPVTGFKCINYDDPVYYTTNHHVLAGLTWEGLKWAFTNLEAGFWHPLTWLSYMADVEFYGRGSRGPHSTNLFLHMGNTVLLFLLLRKMTGKHWQSAIVAALFALHPLRVEPVAWISSRKDVLSTFFGLIALISYATYAQKRLSATTLKPLTSGHYWLALLLFAASLMSKSMLVTLPFVMLLLDYWPLQRFTLSTLKSQPSTALRLALEKLPFLVLSILSGLITVHAEKGLGAISSVADFPILNRFANAFLSCAAYLKQIFWPVDLVVHYAYPKTFSPWLVGISVAIVLLITAVAIWKIVRRPYVAVGWFWYVVTISPVIGLIQIGNHAHADRYSYVPLIGVFIVLVWGLNEILSSLKLPREVVGAIVVVAVGACVWKTSKQLAYWKDSESVFRHEIAVAPDNTVALCNLGIYQVAIGRVDEGIGYLQQAIQIDPLDAISLSNLGAAFAAKDSLDEAREYCRKAVEIKPDCPEFLGAYGAVLALRKEYPEAIAQYEAALRLKPNYTVVRVNLAKVLALQEKPDEAIAQYTEALRLSPGNPEAHYNLGLVLSAVGRTNEAMEHYSEALRFKADDVEAHNKLGDSLLMSRRVGEAALHYQESLKLNPNQPAVHFNLGNVLALQKDYEGAIAQYSETIRLAPDHAPAHKNLGMALARLGRRDEAIAHLTEAVRLKPDYQEAKQQLRALGVQVPE